MDNQSKLSTTLYTNRLDIKKFERLLRNNDQGYKFYWLEAIMRMISSKAKSFTFDKIINKMIWEAWRAVTHYHLRLGHTVNGNAENFLEHAIRILYECSREELANKTPSKEKMFSLIKKYDERLVADKNHLTDYVPYRMIKPFVDKEGKSYIDKKNYGRFIAYLDEFNRLNQEFFYNIIDASSPLQKSICLNTEWRAFMKQNYVSTKFENVLK